MPPLYIFSIDAVENFSVAICENTNSEVAAVAYKPTVSWEHQMQQLEMNRTSNSQLTRTEKVNKIDFQDNYLEYRHEVIPILEPLFTKWREQLERICFWRNII